MFVWVEIKRFAGFLSFSGCIYGLVAYNGVLGGISGYFRGYILHGGSSDGFHITLFPNMLIFFKIIRELFVYIIRIDYFYSIINQSGKPTNHKPQTTNHDNDSRSINHFSCKHFWVRSCSCILQNLYQEVNQTIKIKNHKPCLKSSVQKSELLLKIIWV